MDCHLIPIRTSHALRLSIHRRPVPQILVSLKCGRDNRSDFFSTKLRIHVCPYIVQGETCSSHKDVFSDILIRQQDTFGIRFAILQAQKLETCLAYKWTEAAEMPGWDKEIKSLTLLQPFTLRQEVLWDEDRNIICCGKDFHAMKDFLGDRGWLRPRGLKSISQIIFKIISRLLIRCSRIHASKGFECASLGHLQSKSAELYIPQKFSIITNQNQTRPDNSECTSRPCTLPWWY